MKFKEFLAQEHGTVNMPTLNQLAGLISSELVRLMLCARYNRLYSRKVSD